MRGSLDNLVQGDFLRTGRNRGRLPAFNGLAGSLDNRAPRSQRLQATGLPAITQDILFRHPHMPELPRHPLAARIRMPVENHPHPDALIDADTQGVHGLARGAESMLGHRHDARIIVHEHRYAQHRFQPLADIPFLKSQVSIRIPAVVQQTGNRHPRHF